MQRVWTWIELVLRRYPWAITLAALIPCAYFDAAGINHIVAASLFKADVDSLTRPAAAATSSSSESGTTSSPTSHHVRDTNQILARNVFDSEAGCLNCAVPTADAEATSDDASAGGETAASGAPEPCTGQAKVTGAVEVEDPLWSFVFVSSGGANNPALPYRVGQTLENKTVSSIGWHVQYGAYVVLREGNSRCFYAQFMPPRPAAPAAPATPPPATGTAQAGAPSGELAAALDQGITRSGDNEFSVRRSLVDRILENQAELMRTTRIMPQEQNGHVVGVQLFGVRDSSLLARLGMRNGDTLNRINGLDIGTPDRALEAYSRLRTADHIQLTLTRNGQPVNIDFNIH
jgi:general secretion pathway protein C